MIIINSYSKKNIRGLRDIEGSKMVAVAAGVGGGGGGWRCPFTIQENYNTGISRFTENQGNILENHGSRGPWKSRFTRKK